MTACEANACLHHLFEAQAQRSPDHIAVVFEQRRLTYAELDRRAELLAQRLRMLGAGPGVLVGLFVERSLGTVIGILGILKAGAAYVPIDAAYPAARIAFMCEDAGLSLVLTDASLLSRLPATTAQAVCLDRFDWRCGSERAPAQHGARPTDLAYVIYTSGTTGRPKGVCVEHGSIVNYVLGVAERLQLEAGMGYATVSTFAADLGSTVVFPALATGGTLHVISEERAGSQALMADYFSREQIDVLKIVPSHLAALQNGPDPGRVMPRRLLVLGGEPSRRDRIERLRALSPKCEIYNHYGPTETTVGVLTYRVGAAIASTRTRTIPVGVPLPNISIRIVDGSGAPVRPGEQGELWVGGRGLARGYLNCPELTSKRFVPDPADADGGRQYRTGDLARYLPDGNIELCGRIDRQVKLHGYRIELDELEGALREQPGVEDAVVLARADAAGDVSQLAAYVVPRRAHQPLWGRTALQVLPDGAPVAHLNKNETDYLHNEIFVLQAYLRHGITIRDGDCIVDAGANIGLFTVFANRLARDLRVFSFEPNPAAFACLKANAEAWGGATKCFPLGLSSRERAAAMTFFEGLSLLSGFHADPATERSVVERYVANQRPDVSGDVATQIGDLIDAKMTARTVSAQLRRLSAVIAEEGIDRIDLLKVNVEKSELEVLLGLGTHDWPTIRQLVVEVDQRKDLEPILSLLARNGYEVLVEQDAALRDTELCYVYAIRPSEAGRLMREQSADAHLRPLPPADPRILAPALLRKHLEARLPRYMVPSVFVLVERIPLTANGKIDYEALAALPGQQPRPGDELATPRSETERRLTAIIGELLKVQNVGIHDDFFDLGGQSLTAIQAVARIREAFEVDVTLRNFLEAKTVAGLAEVIDRLSWAAGARASPRESADREEFVL